MTVTVDSPQRPTAELLLGEAGFVHALVAALTPRRVTGVPAAA